MKKIFVFYFLLFATISFSQTPTLELYEIQGNENVSSYNNQRVKVTNKVVTFIGYHTFFIQSQSSQNDNNQNTSEGLAVYVGESPNVKIGDIVNITGSIQEYRGLTEFSSALGSVVIDVVGSSNDLPAPIILDASFPDSIASTVEDLESVEGMRVKFEVAVALGPTDENGKFPARVGNTNYRSFREPGILFPGQTGLPIFDGNPEVIFIDTRDKAEAIDISTGMILNDVTGVLYQEDDKYYLQTIQSNINISGSPVLSSVRNKTSDEISIGSINLERLFTTNNPARFKKIAQYIVNQLNSPDILAVQEVNDMEALQKVLTEVHQLDNIRRYNPYLIEANGSDINVGYLVSKKLSNPKVTALGVNEEISTGGRLHDRPPLLLEVNINNAKNTLLQVMNLHLRSLNGITGDDASRVRKKRSEQAKSVANMVEQLDDNNLVLIGDFNAHEFSDGYVDVVNQITGNQSLGALLPTQNIVNPPLTNHTANVENGQRYSYIFNGNSQFLDHCLSNELKDMEVTGLDFARGNADNPKRFYEDFNSPYRISDHDGFVLFLKVDELVSINEINAINNTFTFGFPNPFSKSNLISFSLSENENLNLQLLSLDGKLLLEKDLGFRQMGDFSYSPNWNLPKGIYVLKITGKKNVVTKKIFLSY